MNLINQFISDELIYALGWTVIHSLWQAMAVAAAFALVLLAFPKKKATVRYLIANIALFLVLLNSIITFLFLYQPNTSTTDTGLYFILKDAIHLELPPIHEWSDWTSNFWYYFNEQLPIIVVIWLLGMSFFTLRLVGSYAYVQHIKLHRNAPVDAYWQSQLETICKAMHIQRSIDFVESSIVKVPMVIGFFKPMVLVPIGIVNTLSTKEVEAILAHELAHIARNDYLLNILQSVIEVIFYFNPAVWWISANIRVERENCCDDLAIQHCGNSLSYAKALVQIQEMYHSRPSMAMSFAGNKNQLLNRIRRILNQPQNRSNIMEKLIATSVLILAIVILSFRSANSNNNTNTSSIKGFTKVINNDFTKSNTASVLVKTDSIPKRSKGKILYNGRDKNVEITIEDGEIQKLKVDGKNIDKNDFDNYEDLIEEVTNNIPPPPPPPPVPPVPSRLSIPVPPAPPVPPIPEEDGNFKIIKSKDKDGNTIYKIKETEGGGMGFMDVPEMPEMPMPDDRFAQAFADDMYDFDTPDPSLFDSIPEVSAALEEMTKAMAENRQLMAEELKIIAEEHKRMAKELKEALANINSNGNHNAELAKAKAEELIEQIKKDQLKFSKKFDLDNEKSLNKIKEELKRERKLLKKELERTRAISNRDHTIFIHYNGSGYFDSNKAKETLVKLLLRDGYIQNEQNYNIHFTNELLKVNGKKLSASEFAKYKNLYESATGHHLGSSFDMKIRQNGNHSSSSFSYE